jgi:Raf kinase inhibitor-like YbhB/YbcL family protein
MICRGMCLKSTVAAALVLLCALAEASAAQFSVESPTVKANGMLSLAQVYNDMGCHGQNTSPALSWRGAPSGTKSYAVTVYDPDAPSGSGWWHWLIYNIPATVSALPEHAGDVGGKLLPAGAVQGHTDSRTIGFDGACPGAGEKPHRYYFTIYALKTEKIDVPADSSAAMVGYMLNDNQLAKATIMARYGH